jgi:hypothetical protein
MLRVRTNKAAIVHIPASAGFRLHHRQHQMLAPKHQPSHLQKTARKMSNKVLGEVLPVAQFVAHQ